MAVQVFCVCQLRKETMKISLPERIQEKLRQDPTDDASIVNLSNNVSAYYTLSPCFFPDYTIHGIDHVNVVLDLADHLIPDETMAYLRPKEVAILVASIIIHDIGMFITEDGLERILIGDRAGNLVQGLDRQPWRDAWAAYCKKIKRCTDRELLRAFGDKEPIESICTVRKEMRRKDYLVCGEFIRRQHHRLAHEIALHGFMGSADIDIFKNTDFTQSEKNLIGLLARSHGMPIRDTESYLKSIFADITLPMNIHLFYLMVVLRIADYLDAGQHRAPKVLQDRQEIDAPISQGEWVWNRIIRYEDYIWSTDRMSLVIQASPETTSLFAKTEKWLHNLQQELDLSWAIMMEYYPRKSIQLSIHRIESNILKESTRATMSQQFLIKETMLTANTDLLKLLIRPLYGNNPSFGVRELLQNAVDACTERKYLEQDENYHGEVTICIESKNKTISITDNGIGMNEDVLRNYYLSAGSSYRYSDNWMADFTQDRKAQIARSGRFGVGVLSVFLLGTSVHVQTRHLKDSRGYEFDFTMDQESIDMRRVDCEVGTTITVELSDGTLSDLKKSGYNVDTKWFEWYAFKEPDVRYYMDGKEMNPLKSRFIVPEADNEDPKWFSYSSPDYESFQWRYIGYSKDEVYCNGISVSSIRESIFGESTGMRISAPCISIVDRMARIAIDLSRSTIFEFPDKDGFIPEAYRYLLAKLLLTKWDANEGSLAQVKVGFSLDSSRWWTLPYIFSKYGFSLNQNTFLVAAGIRQLLRFGYHPDTVPPDFYNVQTTVPIIYIPMTRKKVGSTTYKNFISGETYSSSLRACRMWGRRQEFDNAVEKLPKYFAMKYREQSTCPGYRRYDRKEIAEPAPAFVESHLDADIFPIVAEYSIDLPKKDAVSEDKNIMLKLLREYLGQDIWIPFEMEERVKKFPKAFEELRYYINKLKG